MHGEGHGEGILIGLFNSKSTAILVGLFNSNFLVGLFNSNFFADGASALALPTAVEEVHRQVHRICTLAELANAALIFALSY